MTAGQGSQPDLGIVAHFGAATQDVEARVKLHCGAAVHGGGAANPKLKRPPTGRIPEIEIAHRDVRGDRDALRLGVGVQRSEGERQRGRKRGAMEAPAMGPERHDRRL